MSASSKKPHSKQIRLQTQAPMSSNHSLNKKMEYEQFAKEIFSHCHHHPPPPHHQPVVWCTVQGTLALGCSTSRPPSRLPWYLFYFCILLILIISIFIFLFFRQAGCLDILFFLILFLLQLIIILVFRFLIFLPSRSPKYFIYYFFF